MTDAVFDTTVFIDAYYLAAFEVMQEIPITVDIAIQVGRWLRGASRLQRLRLSSDAMIAATASSLGIDVLTRNPRDLSRFYPGVRAY